jgi:Gas vesicle synthesis protein GvpL/GvpF
MSTPGRAAGAGGTAWYVYGVVPADTPRTLFGGVSGVGADVGVLGDGKLGAIVSEVPLAQFDDEPLAANLHDPGWLEEHVRRHDAVLAAAVRETPVVPFRFGTIYRSEEHVREMLGEQARLVEALEAFRGRLELGVKGFAAPDDPASAEPDAGASPGRRYLEEKQQARRAAQEREDLLARAADESHARLAGVADAARANPPQPAEVSGRDGEMFLNGAYLVSAAKEDEFRRVVATLESELGASGIAFEVTGPWPPYNFVEVDA